MSEVSPTTTFQRFTSPGRTVDGYDYRPQRPGQLYSPAQPQRVVFRRNVLDPYTLELFTRIVTIDDE